MGFLTSFPPYMSPCSLAAFFRRQKQRRKASLQLGRENQENQQQQIIESPAENSTISSSKSFRIKLITVGPNWIMQSYNRRIRNQTISSPQPQSKQALPSQLSQFELVSVRNCRISNKNVSNRRNELCECCPIARSGHRIFADQDFIYVIGGYNQILSNDRTYTDVWRFNRLTQEWQECCLADPRIPLPNTLASFSLVQINSTKSLLNGQNEVYIFGGTGFPFGQEATNEMHRIRIDAKGQIHIQLEENEFYESLDGNDNVEQMHQPQFPPPMYGHACCYRIEERDGDEGRKQFFEVVYLAGGTTGHFYNMDIWRLERATMPENSPWKAKLLNMNGFETGRYRLEAILHGQILFTFGGGAPDFVAEFNEILAFNLYTRKFELIKTQPDPVFGIPRGRKCHALVQKNDDIFIIGGCRDTPRPGGGRPEHQIIDDIWRFNLNSLTWNRIRTNLVVPVYFHSATITQDGCIYVFGGCIEDPQSQTRVNRMQRLWLNPPSLKFFAANALIKGMSERQRQRIGNAGIRLSDTEALISQLFAAGLAA